MGGGDHGKPGPADDSVRGEAIDNGSHFRWTYRKQSPRDGCRPVPLDTISLTTISYVISFHVYLSYV